MMDKPEPRPSEGYWTEERLMIQATAREFALEEILPVANRLDPDKGKIPQELIAKMGELGFFGILIPERHGGLGLGFFEYCLVAEELARGWMSVASIIARGNMFYTAIPARSNAEREDKTRRMARGEYLGAFAMSEPAVGSDIAAIACRAVRDGDDYVVTGNKYWCSFADEADFLQVICRTSADEGAPRWAGLTSVLFEKERGSFPQGVSGQPIPKIGYHGIKTYELAFDEARTPAYDFGTEGGAFKQIVAGLEGARAHTAARSIGVARGALEDAIAYAKDRQQFGRPISDYQAIRFKLASMATEVEAARQLMYSVCHKLDNGENCAKEAAMVKYYAAEMAERVTSEAMQVMGGAGYTTLHAVERYWRDARLTKIFEGSSEIQQKIIADALLGKETTV